MKWVRVRRRGSPQGCPRPVVGVDVVAAHSAYYVTFPLPNETVPRPAAHADPFLAVADPTRRAILDQLRDGEAPVAQLAAAFDMTRPAVSRHLRVLRDARLVRERRGGEDGRQRIYQLTPGPLREVAQWADGYTVFWRDGLSRLKRHVERGAGPARRER
jgi:DNA-binding transcriptional ArsR family regulator